MQLTSVTKFVGWSESRVGVLMRISCAGDNKSSGVTLRALVTPVSNNLTNFNILRIQLYSDSTAIPLKFLKVWTRCQSRMLQNVCHLKIFDFIHLLFQHHQKLTIQILRSWDLCWMSLVGVMGPWFDVSYYWDRKQHQSKFEALPANMIYLWMRLLVTQ